MDHEVWGFVLQIAIAIAAAVTYFHIYIRNELINLRKDFSIELEKIEENQTKLLNRYEARGIRITKAFEKIKTRYIVNKNGIEDLYHKVYDNTDDIEEIYEKTKMERRKRRLSKYDEWRKKNTPDFDTMNDIQFDDNSLNSSVLQQEDL